MDLKILNKKIFQNKNGLTLIETLVAITIFMVAITGAMSLVATSLESSQYAKDQMIAYFLASEGMEGIRNVRDNSFIAGSDWMSGLAACQGQKCKYDASADTVSTCGGSCEKLRHDDASGFYGYNTAWDESIYTRDIVINTISDYEKEVVVTVSWTKLFGGQSFSLTTTLMNWYGN